MSEQQNQLKSPKVQNTGIIDDKGSKHPYQTSQAVVQGQLSFGKQNPSVSKRSDGKNFDEGPLEIKGLKGQSAKAQSLKEVNQSKQQERQTEKEEQLEVEDSLIPLCHTKRQKSLSPIKSEHSIASEQKFPMTGPKINLPSMPKVSIGAQQSIRSEVQSQTSYLLIKAQQICYQPVTHSYRKQMHEQGIESARRSRSRRTQIFSSDKKHTERALILGNNSIAEQMLNQNKAQRGGPSKFQLQNHVYINKHEIVQKASPMQKKSRIQSFETLSNSKNKQIQKLQEMFASPQKASLQYWQSIYPQSKKYLASLTSVLSEEKKVLQKWQSNLQSTLRQALFEVEQILLQKMYQICRLTVKRWVEEEIQDVEGFCKERFGNFVEMRKMIQKKQGDLEAVQKSIESFKSIYENNFERSRVYRLIEGTILSSEYTDEISEISVKVKDLISKSQEMGVQFCSGKLKRAKQLESFQYNNDKYRLDKITYELLKALFKKQEDESRSRIRKSPKKYTVPDMNIGDRIQKILQKSDNRNAETARQASFSQFSSSKFRMPMSNRKNNFGGFKIKDSEKEFEQFQSEFEMRQQNFAGTTSVHGQEKDPQQLPTSYRAQKSGGFEKKLSSILKKISDQKMPENQEPVNNLTNPNNYNEYQQLMRKKKQNNRQNFFRYSMQ